MRVPRSGDAPVVGPQLGPAVAAGDGLGSPAHQDRALLNLANQAAGDLGRAVPLFEAVLADFERVMGPDHPYTLASRNDLASARHALDPPRT